MRRRQEGTGHPLVPERIGRYDVLLPIASGGMATVYLARSRGVGGFEAEVALKVMHAHLREDEEFARDLVEEAKLAVRIQHPNVVRVRDVGDDPHGIYLVMDYIEGDSLAGLVRSVHERVGTVPPRIGLKILYDALIGLHAAHELRDKQGVLVGLVHRDFSPQNILVGLDGLARLTDFGVAKAQTRSSYTATGLVKGKVHYMPPEQARTEPLDRRCDIWAAGVIAWEMLARQRLYKDRNEAAILLKLITEPPPRLRRVTPDVPQALEDVVAHALTQDVASRCPSADAMARGLAHGAETLGGLADQSEVAAFVREHTERQLEKRREQASKVLALRASISSIAQTAALESDVATPSSYGARRPSDDSGSPQPATIGPEEPDGPRASDPVLAPPRRSQRHRALFALAAVVLGGAVAWLTVGGMARDEPEAEAAPSSPRDGASTAIAPTPETGSSSATASPGGGGAAATSPAEDDRAAEVTVKVTANTPMTDVMFGERAVSFEPDDAIDLALRAGEAGAEKRVRAISEDGRRTEATWRPGMRELTLTFPPAAGIRPPRPHFPTRPQPPPAAEPLAPNPFDNR